MGKKIVKKAASKKIARKSLNTKASAGKVVTKLPKRAAKKTAKR